MAITYTEEQRELVKLVRDVARNEVMPHVAAADKAGECPRELYQWGFDLGLHMVEIPEQFGGMGLSYETCAMMFEELAWVDAAYADTFVTNFVAFRNILLNGTEEQARHFVEKTENNGFAAFCLTEANAGSDVAAMRTTAVLDGDEYVLNGTKTFITNGSISDIYVVFAKTDPEAGAHGITGFLIDGDTPGLAAGAEHKMGFRLSGGHQRSTRQSFSRTCDGHQVRRSFSWRPTEAPSSGKSDAACPSRTNALSPKLSRAFISTHLPWASCTTANAGSDVAAVAATLMLAFRKPRMQAVRAAPHRLSRWRVLVAGYAGRYGHQRRGGARPREQLHGARWTRYTEPARWCAEDGAIAVKTLLRHRRHAGGSGREKSFCREQRRAAVLGLAGRPGVPGRCPAGTGVWLCR